MFHLYFLLIFNLFPVYCLRVAPAQGSLMQTWSYAIRAALKEVTAELELSSVLEMIFKMEQCYQCGLLRSTHGVQLHKLLAAQAGSLPRSILLKRL